MSNQGTQPDGNWALWVDDTKRPYDTSFRNMYPSLKRWGNITWAQTCEEAQMFIEEFGLPAIIYLDGYLGTGMPGMEFLKWLKTHHYEAMKDVKFCAISSDLYGSQAMRKWVGCVWGEQNVILY